MGLKKEEEEEKNKGINQIIYTTHLQSQDLSQGMGQEAVSSPRQC